MQDIHNVKLSFKCSRDVSFIKKKKVLKGRFISLKDSVVFSLQILIFQKVTRNSQGALMLPFLLSLYVFRSFCDITPDCSFLYSLHVALLVLLRGCFPFSYIFSSSWFPEFFLVGLFWVTSQIWWDIIHCSREEVAFWNCRIHWYRCQAPLKASCSGQISRFSKGWKCLD